MNTKTQTTLRAAVYARVSTTDQTCENQLLELHRALSSAGRRSFAPEIPWST